MRFRHLVLVGLLLVACSEEPPVAPETNAKSERVLQVEAMLNRIAENQGSTFSAGCYPERGVPSFDLSRVAYMAITAVEMEQEGWQIACASFGVSDDSYGAVHPQTGVLFECPIAEGPVIVMRRGSMADGTAECAVIQ